MKPLLAIIAAFLFIVILLASISSVGSRYVSEGTDYLIETGEAKFCNKTGLLYLDDKDNKNTLYIWINVCGYGIDDSIRYNYIN